MLEVEKMPLSLSSRLVAHARMEMDGPGEGTGPHLPAAGHPSPTALCMGSPDPRVSKITFNIMFSQCLLNYSFKFRSLKRENPDLSEDVVLIRALRDSNLPKFLTDDAILFR